jgi:hypothetical protein
LDTLYRTSVRHITSNAKSYVTSLYERVREVELPATYEGDDVVVDIGRDGANARLSSKDGGVYIEVESRTEQGATLLRSFLGHDETAIPGIARLLEKIGPAAQATVFIEIEDAAERQPLAHSDNVTIHWLERNGLPVGRNTMLADAIKAVALPQDRTRLVWIGAEMDSVRELRRYFKSDLGLDRLELHASAYWRHGKAVSASV